MAAMAITATTFAQSKPVKSDTAKNIKPAAYKADPNRVFEITIKGTAAQLGGMSFAIISGIPQVDRTNYELQLRDQVKSDAADLNKQLVAAIDAALKADKQKFVSDSLKAVKIKK